MVGLGKCEYAVAQSRPGGVPALHIAIDDVRHHLEHLVGVGAAGGDPHEWPAEPGRGSSGGERNGPSTPEPLAADGSASRLAAWLRGRWLASAAWLALLPKVLRRRP